jgi:hypothetical protein
MHKIGKERKEDKNKREEEEEEVGSIICYT